MVIQSSRKNSFMSYLLLDSGDKKRLEKFGNYLVVRPFMQALWRKRYDESVWDEADAIFNRDDGNRWFFKNGKRPDPWVIDFNEIKMKISLTDFGHLGLFPEHGMIWRMAGDIIDRSMRKDARVLNLFAYSGGATTFLAKKCESVCHLDASRGMVFWAKENARLNGLEGENIRWIIDDAKKFLKREIRRGVVYDAIILDPPTFGRGSKGEIFKIENDLLSILDLCRKVLSEKPLFVVVSTHTVELTPLMLKYILKNMMSCFDDGKLKCGELTLPVNSDFVFSVPSGKFAIWSSL